MTGKFSPGDRVYVTEWCPGGRKCRCNTLMESRMSIPTDILGRPISHAQDALEQWEAQLRMWDLLDAGRRSCVCGISWTPAAGRKVCARMGDPKPPLHQPWVTNA